MSKKYLDDTGLSHFWDKIKAKISGDISAEAGKMIPYGYCQTAKGTVAKTVTVSPAVTEITTGLTIAVRFQYENTSSNPTLNVNGLGAHAIKRYGTTAPSTSATGSWNAGSVNILTYNGSYWMLCDWNNTTYSSMTVAEYEAGTGTTARLITPARLKGAIEHWATGETNVQSDWGQTDDTADDFIKNKPTLFSGSYNDLTDKPSNATQSQAGLMSAIDKQKLDALLVITQDSESGEVTIGTGASQNTSGEVTI